MERPNIESQGMLKMLQDLYFLLKDGKQDKACNICEKVGMEQKYWARLTNNFLIVNVGPSRKPIYKWDTIEPNMYMALETLKDYPRYGEESDFDFDKLYQRHSKALLDIPATPKQENIIPPKLEWVKEYCKLRGNDIDASHFIKYYQEKDWKINGKKMKNWKLTINTWESNQKRPFVIKKVENISEISDSDLINELKRRGYTGEISKKIDI